MFGIISGSGLYDIPGLEITGAVEMKTPYGQPSDSYRTGEISGKKIVFLPRHGSKHNIQPHRINYRANIWGMKEIGVKRIISIGASGGIKAPMRPGLIAVPDQLMDFTSGRSSTFYEGNEVVHIDFTRPFCPDLREYVLKSAEGSGIGILNCGTYVCVNGPRLETAAEINAFSLLGADMVGMTAATEAVLARELELCFAFISVITNFAAGVSGKKLTSTEVVETMRKSAERIKLVLDAFFTQDFSPPECSCGRTLEDAGM